MTVDPGNWLLKASDAGNGKPWGTDTNMAGRAKSTPSQPWDTGCKVTTFVGGYAAMSAMRDALEIVISAAKASSNPFGSRGHVYIADWRFNCQRDLSSTNSWKTGAWGSATSSIVDQTAIGLVLRLMQAGVNVRILVWFPTLVENVAGKLFGHVLDHTYLWSVIQKENDRLVTLHSLTTPIGVVGLDRRTADGSVSGTHHQKLVVIRSPTLDVAFCGGVDLAFTRRDAPEDPATFTAETVLDGDWQSGTTMPSVSLIPPGIIWPPDASTDYSSAAAVKPWPATFAQGSDLPTTSDSSEVCTAIGGTWNGTSCSYKYPDGATGPAGPIYGATNQYWHDQHLQLEGSIVETLEWQFWERWVDPERMDDRIVQLILKLKDPLRLTDNLRTGTVLFSTDKALTLDGVTITVNSKVVPLDNPVPIATSVGPSVVQMWRTIPMRDRPAGALFDDGEFTIMAGIANAISKANELIWIFDQFFWSEPAARLLNYRLTTTASLHIIIILPPHADSTYREEHLLRQLALTELTQGLTSDQRTRVFIYDMWHMVDQDPAHGSGIYVHAKAHTYDGALLVCGSANMNRRSLMCDSELACAVVDPDLVKDHQRRLWKMLFKDTPTGGDVTWPDLDLNQSGNGALFFAKFLQAAGAPGAYLVPDPWDDANPLNQPFITSELPAPAPIVKLPNGVPRAVALLGPKYEATCGVALDPSSLVKKAEDDVIDETTQIARPVRLDEVVARVEGGGSSYRQRTSPFRGEIINLAGVVYTDGTYGYTETAAWWKQFCAGLPCFMLLGWPDYETAIFDNIPIDGQNVVLQLWRGWCQRFVGLKGMPGGIGAEVGVYRRIPGQFQKFLHDYGLDGVVNQVASQKRWIDEFGWIPDGYLTDKFYQLTDAQTWWPFTELNAKVEFTLRNPTTNQVLFSAGGENTYWLCKWMLPEDYTNKVKADPSRQAPAMSKDYTLEFTVTGKSTSFSGTWATGDGRPTWPP
jgi:hypothetical protein